MKPDTASRKNGSYAKVSKFKYQNRGYERTLVLVPGWGFDARIFEPLDLDFNYLISQGIDIERFNEDLIHVLARYNIKEVSMLGWSMGGFLALNFLKEYGQAVREIFLVSMRKRFPKEQIDAQKAMLIEDRKLYLTQFYRNCFLGNKRAFKWFNERLFSSYVEIFDLESLLKGLDYLAQQELEPALPDKHAVRLVHGKKDGIAPYSELLELMEGLSFPASFRQIGLLFSSNLRKFCLVLSLFRCGHNSRTVSYRAMRIERFEDIEL
ncbi:MAG: alpha/beta hydrolase [Deltaproteobacteria bacterium]|nr:alpha/beta hydrolase [Deltaproteobacteria bacterium]